MPKKKMTLGENYAIASKKAGKHKFKMSMFFLLLFQPIYFKEKSLSQELTLWLNNY